MNSADLNHEPEFSITELARAVDITTRYIRFHEDRGLLCPAQRDQQCIYSHADKIRLRLIFRDKRLEPDDIRQMIELYELPDGERKQLQVMLKKSNCAASNN